MLFIASTFAWTSSSAPDCQQQCHEMDEACVEYCDKHGIFDSGCLYGCIPETITFCCDTCSPPQSWCSLSDYGRFMKFYEPHMGKYHQQMVKVFEQKQNSTVE